MRRTFGRFSILCVFASSVSVGSTDLPLSSEAHLIVRLKGSASERVFQLPEVRSFERLVPSMGIYSIALPAKSPAAAERAAEKAIGKLRKDARVQWVQFDHPLSPRAAPNDPFFREQWALSAPSLGAIGILPAWDFGTGGIDRRGREVVVAVVDGGFDLQHPDLIDNIWRNSGEIPGNQIDDDGNGYVDDVYGWNAFEKSGTIPLAYHGTHVGGIVGARGDNGRQVVGVNWKVRLMPVAGSSYLTSTALRAYAYVIAQKTRWLETGGKSGANVVVTNSSFGVNFADCRSGDYPAWNEVYDRMGSLGILSAAATANLDLDVDRLGDIPTSCESPFLVTVTNSNVAGRKAPGSAFGLNSVDLAAPGEDILSTLPGGTVGQMSGTSMATPHVAGAIALLHAIAPESFLELYQANPGRAALVLRDRILNAADSLAGFRGATVTGGGLNVGRAAEALARFSDDSADYLPQR